MNLMKVSTSCGIFMTCCLIEKGYVYVLDDFNADLGNSAGSKGLREPNSRGKKLSKFVDHFNLTAVNLLGNSSGPLETYISHCGRFRSIIYWVAVSRTYVFTLQEVEKICRTLQSHVVLVWTIRSLALCCFLF